VVHAGPNSQLGGLNEGLFRPLYHVGIAFVVASEPTPPATRTTASEAISFSRFGPLTSSPG